MGIIDRENDEMWELVRTFKPRLNANCKMEEEIVNDGGVWVDNHQSDLIKNPDHFLRVQMRYENHLYYGVVEADRDNKEYYVWEDGIVKDSATLSVKISVINRLLEQYGCLL